jgi:uncharacterized protein (DUF934 family)
MANLIKDRRVAADTWQLLERVPGDDSAAALPGGDLIVPLSLWIARRGDFGARKGEIGVWLDAHEGPEAIANDVGRFAVIALRFPKFGDGRAYSTARLLRERYGYKGELRAVGDVLHDHLYFMEQCGFDAFALREDQDAQEALSVFSTFSDGYQTSALRPAPLFRRRLAAGKP